MTSEQEITIAIDGPAGAGKSTVAKGVARALGYSLVDTGAIYRSVALVADRSGVGWEDEAGLAMIVESMQISFELVGEINRVALGGVDESEPIRTPHISKGASCVSQFPAVRNGLLKLQRRLAGGGGAVLEGRDIGTVVFPDAPVKIFLDASPQVRARRRVDELVAMGQDGDFEEILREINNRDLRDRTREHAPLKAAPDAIVLDSTQLSADSVIQIILGLVAKVVNEK